MKRRGFLGFLGGAAVVGPSAAKAAIAELPSGLGNTSGAIGGLMSHGEPATAAGMVDGSWKLKEIANLRRFLTGAMTDEEKEEQKRARLYQQERIISQSVASLVSISGVRKLDMYRDRMEAHNRKIRISEAQSRLHRLLRDDT